MSSYRQSQNKSEVHMPSLPSNLPVKQEEYVFNSIGFYGGLLNRLDESIKSTEELYKQSFYKVTSYHLHQPGNIDHLV